VEGLTVLKTHTEAAAPTEAFPIFANDEGLPAQRLASPRTRDLKQRILQQLPEAIPLTGDRGWKLEDVKKGTISLDTFLAQLDETDLEAISRGAYVMEHPLGARGNAGIFGGVTESLRRKGIPPVTTTDGPSGIRLYDSSSLLPIGTLLGCSFDTELVERLYAAVGQEMRLRGSDVLLAPGMNIHRNPLCGRNFEYFSEDPYLTGRMAAAVVRGVQSQGLSACPKHFACNNQEVNRKRNDSVVSERALREIYLKGFEICVKKAYPKNLMTSYNKINGVWGHYHYDLVKTILRDEWGYAGNVMTDWWMQYAPSPEFPELRGNAYRIRSRVDVLMPGGRRPGDKREKPDGTLLATYKKENGITLGEMQEAARNVLRCVMALK
jgi:beta-glucosidase